ncbi:MAG TPA: serine hydrolase, partial [Opitutae bacterium]|nr:serine hydrolase [Opitutae bacterium]
MNLTLRIAFVHACLLALASLGYARELPTVKPAEAGMSAPGLAKVDQAMEELLGKKKFSGAVVAIARHGKVVHFKSYGMMDRERGKPMTEDAIFRIYSMTKAIVTTGAL